MPRTETTREEWAASTERARRLARFRFALDRVAKIADGEPRFTGEELAELAEVLISRIGSRDEKAPAA